MASHRIKGVFCFRGGCRDEGSERTPHGARRDLEAPPTYPPTIRSGCGNTGECPYEANFLIAYWG